MWRYKLPHKGHPFKQNVWDIENGQQPLVLCVAFVEGFAHPGSVCIANVAAIEGGHEIFTGGLACEFLPVCSRKMQLTQRHDHRHQVEIQLAHYAPLHNRINGVIAHTLRSIALNLGDGLSLLDVCHCEKFDCVVG